MNDEGTVTLTTYPPHDPEHANECREFTIPVDYARKLVAESQAGMLIDVKNKEKK